VLAVRHFRDVAAYYFSTDIISGRDVDSGRYGDRGGEEEGLMERGRLRGGKGRVGWKECSRMVRGRNVTGREKCDEEQWTLEGNAIGRNDGWKCEGGRGKEGAEMTDMGQRGMRGRRRGRKIGREKTIGNNKGEGDNNI
jgi:hypothetical protein